MYDKINKSSIKINALISLGELPRTRYLKDIAESNGFEMKDTAPNGNCMFQSVADQLKINGDFRFTSFSLRVNVVR